MRCLLIDDNPIDLMVNERVISRWIPGSQIIKVQSADEGLNFLKSSSDFPQIILLDINMPLKNGFDFLEEYAQLEAVPHKSISVYILSSSLDPEDIRRAQASKYIRHFLQKPLDIDELQNIKSVFKYSAS